MYGGVGTAAPVPTGGAWVTITSSDNEHAVVLGTFVPERTQFGPVSIRIAAEWSGSVTLTAAAGGVVQRVNLDIRPPGTCRRPVEWLLDTIYSCPDCLNARWLNTPGDFLAEQRGQFIFVSRDSKIRAPVSQLYELGNASISEVRLNNQGQLWGRLDGLGKSSAFIGPPPWIGNPMRPLVLEGVELVAVNDMGIAAATREQNKRSQAVIVNSGYVMALPLKADWSRAVGLNNRGEFVGVMSNGDRISSFVYTEKGVQEIEDLGEGGAIATAISESGDITGFAPFKQQLHAFLAQQSSGKWITKDLGVLSGFDSMRPTAVNTAGIVVGVASTKNSSSPFIYSPDIGLVDLNQLMAKTGVQFNEVVLINDANQILASGVMKGQKRNFVLEPKVQK
jgi:hypothetical protein